MICILLFKKNLGSTRSKHPRILDSHIAHSEQGSSQLLHANWQKLDMVEWMWQIAAEESTIEHKLMQRQVNLGEFDSGQRRKRQGRWDTLTFPQRPR